MTQRGVGTGADPAGGWAWAWHGFEAVVGVEGCTTTTTMKCGDGLHLVLASWRMETLVGLATTSRLVVAVLGSGESSFGAGMGGPALWGTVVVVAGIAGRDGLICWSRRKTWWSGMDTTKEAAASTGRGGVYICVSAQWDECGGRVPCALGPVSRFGDRRAVWRMRLVLMRLDSDRKRMGGSLWNGWSQRAYVVVTGFDVCCSHPASRAWLQYICEASPVHFCLWPS